VVLPKTGCSRCYYFSSKPSLLIFFETYKFSRVCGQAFNLILLIKDINMYFVCSLRIILSHIPYITYIVEYISLATPDNQT